MSPFGKVVIVHYYDGPAEGILTCTVCEGEYRFDLVDYDELDTRRIFAFHPLPLGSLNALIKILATESDAPIWPRWSPAWDFVTHEELEAAAGKVQEILSAGSGIACLVSTDSRLERVIAAKPLTLSLQDHMAEATSSNEPWPDLFKYLGITGRSGLH